MEHSCGAWPLGERRLNQDSAFVWESDSRSEVCPAAAGGEGALLTRTAPNATSASNANLTTDALHLIQKQQKNHCFRQSHKVFTVLCKNAEVSSRT